MCKCMVLLICSPATDRPANWCTSQQRIAQSAAVWPWSKRTTRWHPCSSSSRTTTAPRMRDNAPRLPGPTRSMSHSTRLLDRSQGACGSQCVRRPNGLCCKFEQNSMEWVMSYWCTRHRYLLGGNELKCSNNTTNWSVPRLWLCVYGFA